MNAAAPDLPIDRDARAEWERRGRELEAESAAAVGQMLEALRPQPRRGLLSSLRRWLAPSPRPTRAEIATRLVCAWTLGKSEAADEIAIGQAVTSAALILSLTEDD